MKDDFIELFDYNTDVNQQLLGLLLAHQASVSARAQQLMNHLLNAHQIWNARILNLAAFGVWQLHDWAELATIDSGNHQTSLKILEAFDLQENISYQNSKGELFSNKIKDVLYHIINHSTYHRAQIASDLRQSGIEPINTDYIFYKRKRS